MVGAIQAGAGAIQVGAGAIQVTDGAIQVMDGVIQVMDGVIQVMDTDIMEDTDIIAAGEVITEQDQARLRITTPGAGRILDPLVEQEIIRAPGQIVGDPISITEGLPQPEVPIVLALQPEAIG
jgi:hypothetical protein